MTMDIITKTVAQATPAQIQRAKVLAPTFAADSGIQAHSGANDETLAIFNIVLNDTISTLRPTHMNERNAPTIHVHLASTRDEDLLPAIDKIWDAINVGASTKIVHRGMVYETLHHAYMAAFRARYIK